MRAMTKKLLSALVVLAMVLSMVPVVGLPAITANAADTTPDTTCPACNATDVTWTPLTTEGLNISDSASHHYYLASDVNIGSNMIKVTKANTKLCLHLNGNTLTGSGSAMFSAGTSSPTLNVIGGNVAYSGTGNAYSFTKASVNIYDVTHTATGSGNLVLHGGDLKMYLNGTTSFNGPVKLNRTSSGTEKLVLRDSATISNLYLDDTAYLELADGWNGSIGSLTMDEVDVAVGASIATTKIANMGTLGVNAAITLASGDTLEYDTDAACFKVVAAQSGGGDSGEGGDEEPDPETPSQAPTETTCPACGAENVVWTELKGYWGKVAVASGHYYISENFDTETAAEDGTWEFFRPSSTTTVCLHLNGQNITSKGRFYIGSSSTLNIVGTGSITYDGTSAQLFQIQTTYLNLYGGTYSCKDSTKDVIYLGNTGQPHLHNDTYIKGKISWQDTKTAKVFAYDSAKIDAITVPSSGKLTLAAGWQGTIGSLTAPVENGLIPAANAEAKDATLGGTITASTGENVIVDETTGQLKLDIAVAAKIGSTEYATAQLAVNAAQAGEVVTLLANATIDITDKSVTVDAAGFNVTVTGEGTLNAIDSANNTYDATKCGTWTISNVTNWVAEANDIKYVLIEGATAGTYTAHRLDIRIGGVNLRTNDAGLYYTAEYKCDEVLAAKIKTYGVAMSLQAVPTSLGNSAYTAIETASKPLTAVSANTYNTYSGAVINILTEAGEQNAANAVKAIYANAYLEINTGAAEPVVVMGDADDNDSADYSLAGVMDAINAGWNETWMIEAAKTLSAQFYKAWQTVFEAVTGYTFTNIAEKASSL